MIYNNPLSPSSINTYLNCGYSWFIKYNRQIKVPPGLPALFGSMIHKINEKYYEKYEAILDIEKALQESINENWKDFGEEYDEPSKKCINNFNLLLKENPVKPLYIEHRFENGDNNTVAIIDLVLPQKIIDYKTSSVFTQIPKLNNEIQGVMCSVNLKYCTEIDIKNIEFQYLKLNKVQKIEITPALIEKVDNIICEVRDKIKNDVFLKNEKCYMCDYKSICKMESRRILKYAKL